MAGRQVYRGGTGKVTIETKQAVEFGNEITLYRVIADDGWSTLWHSTLAKAIKAYARRVVRG